MDAHLTALRRSGRITTWYDGELVPGMLWEQIIEQHLNSSDIILLLISPDFMKSEYCYGKEMVLAIERHKAGTALVVPILLRPVDFMGAPFANLHILPSNAHAVTSSRWVNRDEALEDVALGLRLSISWLLQERDAATQQISVPDEQETNSPFSIVSNDTSGEKESKVLQSTVFDADSLKPSPVKAQGPQRLRFSGLLIIAFALIIVFTSVFTLPRLLSGNAVTTKGPLATPIFASPTFLPTTPSLALTTTSTTSIATAGPPTFSDPLLDNSKGLKWDEGSAENGSCRFVPGKYYLLQSPANQGLGCNTEAVPQSVFANFIFQITMTILAGMDNTHSGAGPTFRVDPTNNGELYKVSFDAMGNWHLWVSDASRSRVLPGALCGSPCPYFHAGLNKSNVFTIQAMENKIDLWMNGYLIDSCFDNTHTSGFLGFQLGSGTSSASVMFRNLRVWRL